MTCVMLYFVKQKARRYDPEGQRTIAVLTKMDLVDESSYDYVMQLARSEVKPMNMGYCATKNRSPRDVSDEMTMQEAKRAELEFFKSHSAFSKLDESLYVWHHTDLWCLFIVSHG